MRSRRRGDLFPDDAQKFVDELLLTLWLTVVMEDGVTPDFNQF